MKSMKGSRGRGQRPRSCNRSTGVSLIFRRSSIGFPLPQNWSEGPKFTFRGADDAGGADDSPHWVVVLCVLHMVRWGDVLFCEICSTRGAGHRPRAVFVLRDGPEINQNLDYAYGRKGKGGWYPGMDRRQRQWAEAAKLKSKHLDFSFCSELRRSAAIVS